MIMKRANCVFLRIPAAGTCLSLGGFPNTVAPKSASDSWKLPSKTRKPKACTGSSIQHSGAACTALLRASGHAGNRPPLSVSIQAPGRSERNASERLYRCGIPLRRVPRGRMAADQTKVRYHHEASIGAALVCGL